MKRFKAFICGILLATLAACSSETTTKYPLFTAIDYSISEERNNILETVSLNPTTYDPSGPLTMLKLNMAIQNNTRHDAMNVQIRLDYPREKGKFIGSTSQMGNNVLKQGEQMLYMENFGFQANNQYVQEFAKQIRINITWDEKEQRKTMVLTVPTISEVKQQ